MSRLRILYILSLVMLGILLVFTVFRPMATGGEYTEVQLGGLLQAEDEWVIQFNIINHEESDQKYTITVVVDGKPYREDVLIQDGRKFTYMHHIRRDTETEKIANLVIYKEGEETPLEQVTYYLR